MQISGTSGAEMRHVARLLRKAAAKDLEEELRKGQRKAFAPLQREVKTQAAATLPKRGGYAGIMSRAVKVTILMPGRGRAVITAHVFARGKRELRDVRAVDAGSLRHPLFGRRLHWYQTSVMPGFVSRVFADIPDRVLRESADAVQRVALQIAKG